MKTQILVVLFVLFNVQMDNAQLDYRGRSLSRASASASHPFLLLPPQQYTLYYFGHKHKLTWMQAMQHCKLLNMDLVAIESKAENDFLNDFLNKYLNNRLDYWFWTSGTILSHTKWAWLSTGRPVVYTNWEGTQPDNANGTEHVLQLKYGPRYGRKLLWNDLNQDKLLHVLCEVRVSQSEADLVHQVCNSSESLSVLRPLYTYY
ncbi:perlucin-like [Diabrotica undecimpunctata]|uniref:perlucin-like n=1 Tax=Diabrotica undecimpunctata TaxID=50387 RepID=UPI003B63F52C